MPSAIVLRPPLPKINKGLGSSCFCLTSAAPSILILLTLSSPCLSAALSYSLTIASLLHEPSIRMAGDDLVDSLLSLSSSLTPVPPDFEEIRADEEKAKRTLSNYNPQSRSDDTAKVLESFIDYLPRDGKRILTKFIATCGDEKTLFDLSKHLCIAILIPMKAYGGKTPAVTSSPFDNADIETEEVAAMMIQPSSRKDQKSLKKMCLERDNFRCMVTGFWDRAARGIVSEETMGDRILDTELAHIIPFSLGKYERREKEQNTARSWTTLYLFFPDICEMAKLSHDDINDPTNAMSLVAALHTEFGRFNFALESTAEENTYVIRTYPGFQRGLIRDLPPPNANNERLVTFKKHGNNCDLPSPVLLDTHAAIAKILHASGKAEDIERILRDREETRCLAPDGSTDIERLLLAW
ncbi:hypothetical protein VTN77DRAFT_7374 [Rasamsonia byssochlamydoides]|uniref:uncharacterized protein n=1 Tax=Rasamsonia byssochlamydoides TaxID=89139 RepID=UPI003742A50A